MAKIKRIIRQYPFIMIVCKYINIRIKKVISYPKNKKIIRDCLNTLSNNIQIKNKKIFYFCIPLHPNLGDQAQKICIEEWVKENFCDYQLFEIPSIVGKDCADIYKLINQNLSKSDFIIIQSGYCTTDLHGIDEVVHRNICKYIKKVPIVFFPQTINFKDNKELKISSSIYNQNKNILFLARDNISYSTLKNMIDDHSQIDVFPDVVTNLIGKLKFANKRKNILFCIRNDGEGLYKYNEIKELMNQVKNKYSVEVDFTDTTINKRNNNYYRDDVFHYFDIFSRYDLIITDRFHGTIFSLIASTPVIVLKTNDHKVYTGADWFTDIYPNFIKKADSLDEVIDLIPTMEKNNTNVVLKPILKHKYYDKLAYMIKEKIAVEDK